MGHARYSDPSSSHETVASLSTNGELIKEVLRAARSFTEPFSDTDLTAKYAAMFGVEKPRNIIARIRNNLETRGLLQRIGVLPCPNTNRKLLYFTVVKGEPVPRVVPERRSVPNGPSQILTSEHLRDYRLMIEDGEIRLMNVTSRRRGPARQQWDLDVLLDQIKLLSVTMNVPEPDAAARQRKRRERLKDERL